MSVSGTTSFTVTRDQIIEAALQDLSVLEEGAQPSSTALQKAAFTLNLIIKNWQIDGIKLWTIDNLVIPLVNGQTVYNIGPDSGNDVVTNKPLKVIQGFLRNMSVSPYVDIPMQALSRQEYNMLGSKFSTGTTNSYFYNPKATYGELSVFLTPDTNTSTNYELIVVSQRPLMDMTKPTDNFDFPSEWFLALKWALQSELANSYDKPLADRQYIDAKAKFFKDELEDWDVENASVFFVPDIRMGLNKGYR
jgi:hypothetical protein